MKIHLIILALLLFSLCSCSNASAPLTQPMPYTSSSSVSTIDYLQLDDASCQPPCWHGIIPNSTTITDALELLMNDTYIELDSLSVFSGTDQLDWTWKGSEQNGGALYSLNNQLLVNNITLNLDVPIDYSTLIAHIGAPSYAILLPFQQIHSKQFDWYVYIVYVDRGMIFSHVTESAPASWENVAFEHIEYMQPDKSILQGRIPDNPPLHPWDAKNDIMTYCYNIYLTVDPCQ